MTNSLSIMATDVEQTQDNHQRGQRVRCMIWQRTWHDKYTQNREEMVALLRVIHAGRSMLCAAAEMHRRGIAHRMEMLHRA
jgi:hypothetical protein